MNVRHQILRDRTIPFACRIGFLASFFAGSMFRQVQSRHGVARSEFLLRLTASVEQNAGGCVHEPRRFSRLAIGFEQVCVPT